MMWSEEMISTAKDKWGTGASASKIADELCREHHITVSRNAVIGKLHRMGLKREDQVGSGPTRSQAPRKEKQRTRSSFGFERRYDFVAPTKVAEPRQAKPIAPAPDTPESLGFPNRKTLTKLTSSHCRYVIGDVKEQDYFFCGEWHDDESSYCRHHHQICHLPPRSKLSTDR